VIGIPAPIKERALKGMTLIAKLSRLFKTYVSEMTRGLNIRSVHVANYKEECYVAQCAFVHGTATDRSDNVQAAT